MKWLEEVIVLLSKKGDELYQELKKLLNKIIEWLKKNSKRFSKVNHVPTYLISYIKILKRNKDYIKSLEFIQSIGRPLGKWLALEQAGSINLYTKSYYINFNKALRKQKGYSMTQEFKALQHVLDDALERLPVSEHNNKILQRSAYFTEKEVNRLFKVGEDFVEEAFFSTTYSEEALYAWMRMVNTDNVLFKVHGKNGKLIEAVSNIPNEAEVLFKSKTVFRVESVRKIDHPLDKSKLITEIILKEK